MASASAMPSQTRIEEASGLPTANTAPPAVPIVRLARPPAFFGRSRVGCPSASTAMICMAVGVGGCGQALAHALNGANRAASRTAQVGGYRESGRITPRPAGRGYPCRHRLRALNHRRTGWFASAGMGRPVGGNLGTERRLLRSTLVAGGGRSCSGLPESPKTARASSP